MKTLGKESSKQNYIADVAMNTEARVGDLKTDTQTVLN